jgi:alanine racemase
MVLNIKLLTIESQNRDKKYAISGRISMDQIAVDIGDDAYPIGKKYNIRIETIERLFK